MKAMALIHLFVGMKLDSVFLGGGIHSVPAAAESVSNQNGFY
jgi:hypothetical protein